MKIAIHQPRVSYYVGGDELVSLEQATRICKNHDVAIVTTKVQENEIFGKFQINYPQVKIARFELPIQLKRRKPYANRSFYEWTLESLFFGEKTFSYYSRENFDLIVTHFVVDSLFIPKRNKNILHLHGVPPFKRGFEKELYRESLKKPIAFVAVADYVKRGWKNFFPFLKEKPIYVITNGVDTERFKPKDVKKKYDVLYVGRLIKTKGVKTLIDAVKEIKKEKEDLKVIIAGEGPEKKSLESYIKEQKLEKNIKLTSYIKENKLPTLYNESKLFVAPSYAREGILGTLLEAMSCGIASIAANCCGLVEAVSNNEDGKLFEPKNSKDLAEKILFLFYNEKERKKLGKKAREKIIKKFDCKNKIEELISIYEKCIS